VPVTDFLAAVTLALDGLSFLPRVLLGVYLASFSAVFLTSDVADSTDFLPAFSALVADLEAAFFLPLAPPLTLA
jgi:hypothetical protein